MLNSNKMKSILQFSILFLFVFSLTTVVFSESVSATWWNNDWSYKKNITVSTADATSRSNVSVLLNVTFVTSNMQTNFGDIRFLDSTETTELGYWFYNNTYIDSNSVRVWVKLNENVSSTTNVTIVMYYGNPNVNTTSNVSQAGIFGDDFLGTNLDWTNYWQASSQTKFANKSSNGILSPTVSTDNVQLNTKNTYSDFILEMRMMTTQWASSSGWYLESRATQGNWVAATSENQWLEGNSPIKVCNGGTTNCTTGGTADPNNWGRTIMKLPSTGYANWTYYGGDGATYNYGRSYIPTNRAPYFAINPYGAASTRNIDWIYYRQYTSSEPAGAFGNEQTNDAANKITIDYTSNTFQNNLNLSASNVFIEVNVTNTSRLDAVYYHLYWANQTLKETVNWSSPSLPINSYNFTGLPDGRYYFNVTANTSNGITTNATPTRIINLDTIKPTVDAYPPNGTYLNATTEINHNCYQEYANVSTPCGGLNTGEYYGFTNWDTFGHPLSNAYDGDWDTNIIPSGTGYFYVNYTIPFNSISAILQTRDYLSFENSTVPNICLSNKNLSIKIQLNSLEFTTTYSNYSCYDGTGYNTQIAYNSIGSGPIYFYEEAMIWNMTSFVVNATDNLTGAGLQSVNISIYNDTALAQTIGQSLGAVFSASAGFSTSLPDGIYTYFAQAFDFAGNFNSTDNRTIILDTRAPQIEYDPGTASDGASNSNNFIFVNVTWTELNPASLDYYLYNTTSSELINHTQYTNNTGFVNATTFTSLPFGDYTYFVTMTDLAGNFNSTANRSIYLRNETLNVSFVTPPTPVSGVYLDNATQNISVYIKATESTPINISFNVYNATLGLVNTSDFVANNGSYVSQTYNLSDGLYFFNVSAVSYSIHTFTETRNMTIDTLIPKIVYSADTLPDGANASQNFVYINVTFIEGSLANLTFNLYDASFNLIDSVVETTQTYHNFTGLSVPSYLIQYYNVTITSFANKQNATLTRKITLDTTAPTVNLYSPDNLVLLTNSSVTFIANVSDPLLQNWTLNIVGPTNITHTGGITNISETNVLADGNYTWNVSACDYANNCASDSRKFAVDSTPPIVSYGPATLSDGINVSSTYIPIELTVTEIYPKNVTYMFYDNNSVIMGAYTTTYTNETYSITKTLPDGTYYYNASVSDLAGWTTTLPSRKIILDTNSPVTAIIPTPEGGSSGGGGKIVKNTSTFSINGTISDKYRGYCYQEYANVSTICNPNGDGNYTSTGVWTDSVYRYDGNWGTYSGTTSGSATFTVNYKLPANFTHQSAWVIKLQNLTSGNPPATYEYVLPDNCYDGRDFISLRYNTNPAQGIGCLIGTGTTYTYFDNTPAVLGERALYEEAMMWAIANTTGGIKNTTIVIQYPNGSIIDQQTVNETSGGVLEKAFGFITTLSDGVYQFFITVADWAGNVYNTIVTILIVDTITPTIDYITPPTPTEGSYLTTNSIPIEVNLSELNIQNYTFNLYNNTGGLVDSITLNDSSNSTTFTPGDGNYSFQVIVFDQAGHQNNTAIRHVAVDTINPVLSFNAPGVTISQFYEGMHSIKVNLSIIETNPFNTTIYISNADGTLNRSSSTNTNGYYYVEFSSLDYGTYLVNASSTDLAGRTNSTSTLTITLSQFEPNINSCRHISMEGGNYKLNESIIDNSLSDHCITIDANAITLDCDNKFILSNDNYAAIYVNSASGVTIKNCNVSMGTSGNGLRMNGGSATVSDFYTHDESEEIYLTGSAQLMCINCNYTTETVEGMSELNRQWRYRTKVVDSALNIVPLSTVTIDNSTLTIYNLGTDSLGYTPWVPVTEYINNGAGITYADPYNVTARKESFPPASQMYTASGNKDDTIVLSSEIGSTPLSRTAMKLLLGILLVVGLITSVSFFLYRMGNSNYTSDMWKYFIIMIIWLVLFLVLFLVLANYFMLYFYPKI